MPRSLAHLLVLVVSLLSVDALARGGGGGGGRAVYVHGYTRSNGTYVMPHMRSAPDGNFWNNWSTVGNVNPYTGKEGTKTAPSAASAGSWRPQGSGVETATEDDVRWAMGDGLPSRAPPRAATPQARIEDHGPSREGSAVQFVGRRADLVGAGEHRANLGVCLDGQYRSLCRHNELFPEESARVREAERRANLGVCLDGQYRSLCRHNELSPDESTSVREAERRANLSVCLDGQYRSLCHHNELSPEESARVREAERRANLSVCLDGQYRSLCHHSELSPEEFSAVDRAERAANLRICLDGRFPSLCDHARLGSGSK